MYKSVFVAILLASGAAAAAAADPATKGAAPATIVISDYAFGPSILTITPGTTVTWVNEDETPHTVTDRGKIFRSAALDTNDRFSYTFTQPGEFDYYCTLHPMMTGKIIVKKAGSPS